MPSIVSDSCHMTSGCSGLPKLRQLTTALGAAPAHARLSAASATVAAVPDRGSREHHAGLESVVRARPPSDAGRPGAARRSTALSPPGPSTVLRKSWWSYWRYTHDGSATRASTSRPQSVGAVSAPGSSARRASWSAGRSMGRWYRGASSLRAAAGTSPRTGPSNPSRMRSRPGAPAGASVTRPTTAARTSHFAHSSCTRGRSSGVTMASIRSWLSDVMTS